VDEKPRGDTMQRTFLVWVIFLLILLCTIVEFGAIFLVYSGALPLPPEALAELDKAGSGEIAVNLIVSIYSLIAGIALFMMRRIALPMFLIGFPITIGQIALAVLNRGWDEVMANGGVYTIPLTFAIGVLVCFYIWTLDRRGALA
jgi:hypothetical protein